MYRLAGLVLPVDARPVVRFILLFCWSEAFLTQSFQQVTGRSLFHWKPLLKVLLCNMKPKFGQIDLAGLG